MDSLSAITAEVIECRACPRLVEWREQVAREKRAAFRDEDYWGRPVPGFGDPAARLLIVGLAPAAHGGNRTGRVFTGDRSGDWLFGALYRAGFANQPTSVHAGDGLRLIDAYVAAVVRCAPPANKPTPDERDNCVPFLVREMALLTDVRVIVVLGQFAYDAVWRLEIVRKQLAQKEVTSQCDCDSGTGELFPSDLLRGKGAKPKFGHGVEVDLADGRTIVCSFHPSQQNTFTGKLTEEMFDRLFARARQVAGLV